MKDKLLTKLSKLLHKLGVEDTKIEEIVNDLKNDKDVDETVKDGEDVTNETIKDDVVADVKTEPIKNDEVKEDVKEDVKYDVVAEKPVEPITEEPKDDLEKEQEEITEEKKNDVIDAHQGEEIVALKEDVNGVKTKMEEYGEKLTALYNALKEAGIIEKEKKDIGLPGKATSMVEEETTADLLKKMNSRF